MVKERRNIAEMMRGMIPIIGVVAVVIIFQIATEGKLLTPSNIAVIINTLFTYLLVSIGATFIYTTGSIDLSLGGLLAVCGLVFAIGSNIGGIFLGIALSLALAVVCEVISGLGQAILNIPPFILTLCLRYIYRGIVVIVTERFGIQKVSASYRMFDNSLLKFAVLIVVFLIAVILFNYTRIGKSAKALGGNKEAARQAGVPVTFMQVMPYIITGVCVMIAAFFAACRQGNITSDMGSGLELNVMVAVVIGGLGVRGGANSKMRCCVIGSIIMAILNNGLVLAGVSATLVEGIKGLLFIIIVWLSYEHRPGDIVQ